MARRTAGRAKDKDGAGKAPPEDVVEDAVIVDEAGASEADSGPDADTKAAGGAVGASEADAQPGDAGGTEAPGLSDGDHGPEGASEVDAVPEAGSDDTESGAGTEVVPAASVDLVGEPAPLVFDEPEPKADPPEVIEMPPVDAADTGDAAKDGAAMGAGAAAGAAAASSIPPSGARVAGERTGPVPTPPPAQGSGGFGTALLGGLVGAALALTGAWFWAQGQEDGTRVEALEAALAEQTARIDAVEGAEDPRMGEIDGRLAAIEAEAGTVPQVTERLNALEEGLAADETPATLAGLDERVADLAARLDAAASVAIDPESGDAGATPLSVDLSALAARVAAAEEEAARIEGVTAQVETLRADLGALGEADAGMAERLDGLSADLAALREEFGSRQEAVEAERLRLETEAEGAARGARIAAQLARVEAAVDTGAPFDDALAALAEEGAEVEVPAVLEANAEGGVPSLAALQAEFPDSARAALAAAPTPEGAGPGAFLTRQLGLRSTVAREGNDADAILSRAEAALAEGDLGAALTELEPLEPSARTPLETWIERAETRRAAMAAAADLTTQTN